MDWLAKNKQKQNKIKHDQQQRDNNSNNKKNKELAKIW